MEEGEEKEEQEQGASEFQSIFSNMVATGASSPNPPQRTNRTPHDVCRAPLKATGLRLRCQQNTVGGKA